MTAAAVSPAPIMSSTVDDWLLTAPWWHWPRQGMPPQDTAPALQKYATTRFAAEFLADPQRRLVFDPTADRIAAPPFDAVTFSPTSASTTATLTKLYQPVHHRHYLVAVELHCGRPGLPIPDRSTACEAGFVVRRRRADVPPELLAQARALQRALVKAHHQLRVINRRLGAAAVRRRVGLSSLTALGEQHAQATARVAQARQAIADWADARGVARTLEGWVALAVDASGTVVPLPERPGPDLRPLPGLGRWVPVPEVSETLDEASYPLYPLIPDPRDTRHDAAGRCLWFGTVPTVSADLERYATPQAGARADRAPRLDDLSVYEIRCVVRRHDPDCPTRPGTRDCHGLLTWSAPTQPFRLAAALDARGSANRPVTVRMPTRAELAEAAGKGFGGIRIQAADYHTEANGSGDFQICSFSIPLITIVATFVLRIFLPIVVFLFGLWVLLALKFCIPPSFSASADLDAALDAEGPSADFEVKFGVEVSGALNTAAAALFGSFGKGGLAPNPAPDPGGLAHNATTDERFAIAKALATTVLRTPDDDLVYEPRIERAEVFRP